MDQEQLERALRTLRGIHQRYETAGAMDPHDVRNRTFNVALGYADMLWMRAAIEALEEQLRSGLFHVSANSRECSGGEGEIRTPEALASLPVFKTGAFNRSATSPFQSPQALE